VDKNADSLQREALVRSLSKQGGQLLEKIVKVESAAIKIEGCPCKKNACFEVDATIAKVRTRCWTAIMTKFAAMRSRSSHRSRATSMPAPPPSSSTPSAAAGSAKPGPTANAGRPMLALLK